MLRLDFIFRIEVIILKKLIKIWIFFIFPVLVACEASHQFSSVESDPLFRVDQDSLKNRTVTQRMGGNSYEKTMNYPYLTIKFQQEDTEVEMVIDPLVTNLQLDMKRKPGSSIEISPDPNKKADSSAVKQVKNEPDQELLADDFSNYDKNITDEILAYLTEAQSLFYQGQYHEALTVLQKSIEKKPTASAYAIGGSIYYVNGDTPKAVQAWEMALKLNPDMPEIKEMIASLR